MWVHRRRPEVLFVLLLGSSVFLYSAWFYGWHTQLGDSLSDYYASDDDHSSSSLKPPKPAPWYPSLNRTHEALLAAHRNYTAKVCSPPPSTKPQKDKIRALTTFPLAGPGLPKQLAGEVLCSPDKSLRLRAAARPRRWVRTWT
jgi:hypothetical protein